MPSNHLILCCPLLLLPSIFPSIRVFSNESPFTLGAQLKLQHPSFQSIFNVDFLQDGLVGSPCSPGTLKSLLQHHSSQASIFQCSAFFMVQLSHPYTTTGKTIALTIQTFVSKLMSLLFNTLSRFVIAFLSRSKRLLISWLQSLFTVILEPSEIKSVTVSFFSYTYLPWSDGTRCHNLSFLNVEF